MRTAPRVCSKEAMLKRQRGLTDEEAIPDLPVELIRWLQFIDRQGVQLNAKYWRRFYKGDLEVFVAEKIGLVSDMWKNASADLVLWI